MIEYFDVDVDENGPFIIKGEKMKKIQQGDVLFKEIDPVEFKKKLKKAKESKGAWNSETMTITSQYGGIKEEKCTVALGEATGHHHSFEDGTPGVIVTAYRTNTEGWERRLSRDNPAQCHYVSVESPGMEGHGVITHQEHNPIKVPSGYYKIEIVKEFDHLSNLERRVVD